MNHIDWELVNWSRAQFALTAMYHWMFVPLTLGTTFMIAIMETIYVKTQDEKWKEITKFWMKLFGINFTIWMLLISVGFNNTACYPSTYDLQSSLTISNASSSEFTLRTMSYVSLMIPFVVGYIALVWRKIDSRKISSSEFENSENHTY